MTLDEAFAALGALSDDLPIEAMQTLLDQWDVAGPRSLALLRGYVAGDDLSEATERALFPLLHLLAEQADSAAFADLCALAGDSERVGLILGEAVIDTLPGLLISCFDQDAARLQALIAKTDADPDVRESALMAMAYLTQAKRIPRPEMHAALVTLHDVFPAEPGFIGWIGWARSVALLGFVALSGRALALFERKLIDPELMPISEFRELQRVAQAEPGSLDLFAEFGIAPVDSAIDLLSAHEDDEGPPLEPIINPLRHIGRNDPCPCGSGQKYKKC